METCQCDLCAAAVKRTTGFRTIGAYSVVRRHEPIPYRVRWGRSRVDPFKNLNFGRAIVYPTGPQREFDGKISPRWIPANDFVSQKSVAQNENNDLLERPF
ncbi:unnamed protein product [Phyllotreta striolata]|uniref:Uncharacterized protein n=1 Tax=Phyllotreta striolata TaxID=444603 RepID=A0A9N9TKM6_PHYSR|nr:unnamed protein product [Phyllotreta striolata]